MLILLLGCPPIADERLADQADRAWRRISAGFGKAGSTPPCLEVSTDMADYRRRTGKPWTIAAALVGEIIVTQPLRALSRVDDVERLLAHEMAHWMIRSRAGRGCPRWLDEGLAQWLAGDRSAPREIVHDRATLTELEQALSRPGADLTQVQLSYQGSLALVQKLISNVGADALIAALPDVARAPDPLKTPCAGRRLQEWLFH